MSNVRFLVEFEIAYFRRNYTSLFGFLILVWIYLLSAIGLTSGGSSTVHIYTQTIHRTTKLTTLVRRLIGILNQSGQTKINDYLLSTVFCIEYFRQSNFFYSRKPRIKRSVKTQTFDIDTTKPVVGSAAAANTNCGEANAKLVRH